MGKLCFFFLKTSISKHQCMEIFLHLLSPPLSLFLCKQICPLSISSWNIYISLYYKMQVFPPSLVSLFVFQHRSWDLWLYGVRFGNSLCHAQESCYCPRKDPCWRLEHLQGKQRKQAGRDGGGLQLSRSPDALESHLLSPSFYSWRSSGPRRVRNKTEAADDKFFSWQHCLWEGGS